MHEREIKIILIISSILSLVTLPMTFIWIEIAPEDKIRFGKNIPDIVILGWTILGKDKSFWGINFAYKFQCLVIIYYSATSLLASRLLQKREVALFLMVSNFFLLIIFPFWLYLYVDGVICNSDDVAANLKIHFGSGLAVYIVLLLIKGLIVGQIKNVSNSAQAEEVNIHKYKMNNN